jgi:hypothetical protein
MKKFWIFIFLFLPLFSRAAWIVDLETGAVFTGYNDIQIPGDTGTRFSLKDDLDPDPAVFFRFRMGYEFADRQHISALVAPLKITAEGTADKNITFQNETFTAGTKLAATYQFNSYRLTYRYLFLKSEAIQLGAGVTAKIRDASIKIKGGGKEAEKGNVGFVPLIHFYLQWNFTEKFSFLTTGDALAAPQGRAEDVLFAFQFHASPRLKLRLGYRILEGGSDSGSVYTFALFHYIIAGMNYRF